MSLALLFNLNNLDAGGGADVTAPTISSATVATNGNSITFAASETVSVGSGGNGGWVLTPTNGGAAVTLTYSSGSGSSSLVYTTSRTITSNETLTYAYTQPGNGVEDTAGNDLASITATAVTNNSTVNNSPTNITLSNSSVLTTSGLNAVVGVATVTDDPGDTHTMAMAVGNGTNDADNASFNWSGMNLRCGDPSLLTPGTYHIYVSADDSVSTPYAEAFTITVAEPGTGCATMLDFRGFRSFKP